MLHIVPTPIGNLKDLTYRAVEVLRASDLILCEDTRRTSVLLRQYDISTPYRSYHQNNEHTQTEQWVTRAIEGSVSLVSDAGTPCISDPGYLLVCACVERQIPIDCLPGPSSVLPALILSGFPVQPFTFCGFLPPRKKRNKAIEKIQGFLGLRSTVVLMEAPHRMARTVEDLRKKLGDETRVSISKELTKKFEHTERGTLKDLSLRMKETTARGEFMIVLSPEKKNNIE